MGCGTWQATANLWPAGSRHIHHQPARMKQPSEHSAPSPSDQAAWRVRANHRDHTKRATALAQTAAGAVRHVVQHRLFTPALRLQTQHMRGAGRHAPATTGAALGVDLRQVHGLRQCTTQRVRPRARLRCQSPRGCQAAHLATTKKPRLLARPACPRHRPNGSRPLAAPI